MTPHPQGNGKPGDVAESEPVAWMTMAPQTAPLVSAAFLRERPEFRNIYTIPLYATPQPAIPPGFKVVPLKATAKMLVAVSSYSKDQLAADATWSAMLSAAPVPEAGQGLHPNHLPDLRYVLNVLHKVRGVTSDRDTAHGELGAAINGMLYIIKRTEETPAPAQAQAPVEVSDNKGALK